MPNDCLVDSVRLALGEAPMKLFIRGLAAHVISGSASCSFVCSLAAPALVALCITACGASRDEGASNSVVRPASFSSQLRASRVDLLSGERVELQADVGGADQKFTYTWRQARPRRPEGVFSSPDKGRTFFTAPEVDIRTRFQLSVTVATELGSHTSDVVVTVDPIQQPEPRPRGPSNASGPYASGPEPTGPTGPSVPGPVLTAVSELASLRSGSRTALRVEEPASFSNYEWTQLLPADLGGAFDDARASQPSFRAPAVATATAFVLRVKATDSGGAEQSSTVSFEVTPATYSDDVQPFLANSCGGCHGGANPRAGLDTSKPDHLTGDNRRTNCGVGKRIVAGDVGQSSLVRRLKGTCVEGGPRMPLADDDLIDREPELLERVESWIMSGATF